jgi:glycosyltransferase involved in cell wall biosynthesis
MLGRMQGAVTVSDGDLSRLREMAPGLPAVVVENGVDCLAYRDLATFEKNGGHRLLYLGLMSYESNIDAVRWFAGEVLPLIRKDYPDTVFTIAGGEPAPEVSRLAEAAGIVVTGFVDDIKPLYRDNDLLVVPLRLGGGSRLKILEAFAAGMPVVSTAKGAEGLRVKDGEQLLLADSPAAMAAAVSRMYSEPEARAALRDGALQLVEECYDWPILARKLADYLSNVAELR